MSFAQELQSLSNMRVVRVQFTCSLIGIKCILDLIIARLVQCTQIIPHFADVRIKSYSAAVSIQRITILQCVANQCQRLRSSKWWGGEAVPPIMGELGGPYSYLVNLVIQDPNGAPKSRIACIAINCLLVGLVCLVVILLCHVATA